MFDSGKENYKTDIKLGEKYRDKITGIQGTAVSVSFYMHACERVVMQTFNEKEQEIKEYGFDAPQLIHIETREEVRATRPGGPGDLSRSEGRRAIPRRGDFAG